MFRKPYGKTSLGIPRCRCEDIVKMVLNKSGGRISFGNQIRRRVFKLVAMNRMMLVSRLFAHWSLSDVWQFSMYSYKIFIRINVCTKFGEVNEGIMSWAPRKKCVRLWGSKQRHVQCSHNIQAPIIYCTRHTTLSRLLTRSLRSLSTSALAF